MGDCSRFVMSKSIMTHLATQLDHLLLNPFLPLFVFPNRILDDILRDTSEVRLGQRRRKAWRVHGHHHWWLHHGRRRWSLNRDFIGDVLEVLVRSSVLENFNGALQADEI